MRIKFIKPSYEIDMPMKGLDMLKHIEKAGRTCYKSEDKITDDSAQEFVKMLIKRGHESVLEHCSFSVRFICDRGVSHELVRHRLCSFSQESTRYVGYGNAVEMILPPWVSFEPVAFDTEDSIFICELWKDRPQNDIWWMGSVLESATTYSSLLEGGWRPEQARSVLPNSLKTEIVVTGNLRQWRTVFKQRSSKACHPQMLEIIIPLLSDIKKKILIVFDDIVC